MMDWLRKNSWWLLLNAFAVGVLVILWYDTRVNPGYIYIDDPLFEQSGRWAIRFLLFSLAMFEQWLRGVRTSSSPTPVAAIPY